MPAPPPRHPVVRLLRRVLPRRVRSRLTLLYGSLFTLSGVALLGVTYLLVTRATGKVLLIRNSSGGEPENGLTRMLDPTYSALRDQAVRQRQEELHHLLVQSGIAMALMVVFSIVLGWLVAGRVLRPLRRMTATIQQISARNLHERLAVDGPRDELSDLAETVDGLLGRLETSLDTHKRFVANAAHELRTPLTVEHALLEETLIDRDADLESFRTRFGQLLSLNEQRARLLESLLTLAGSERGLDRHEPMDLAELVTSALSASRREAERREVRIDVRLEPAPVSGDPALVERLVINLLDNAIGYNVAGGGVRVETRTEDDRSILSVTNTGIQVPAEQVDRLFEPFQRLSRTARGDGHHGLGLSIVLAIATAHAARVNAHALPEGGLSVEVVFAATATRRPQRARALTG